jgi:hypothetical protein
MERVSTTMASAQRTERPDDFGKRDELDAAQFCLFPGRRCKAEGLTQCCARRLFCDQPAGRGATRFVQCSWK